MAAVVIGVDPAKRSHTVEVLDASQTTLAAARFDSDNTGYRQMRALARGWPARVWAVEGATGVGLQLAQRLVADGEQVLDVPSKLSTRARAIDTGHGRKNDPADAHAVAVVGLRTPGLRQVVPDDQMVALRLLADRCRDLVRSRTQAVNRLQRVLMELIPAGAPRNLTASAARKLVASVRPRDVAGRARRQLAVDLIDDVSAFDRKIKAIDARIGEAVAATGTHLTDIVGVGPITAATILGEVGDVARFASSDHFASYTGTAPIEDLQRRRRAAPAVPGRQPPAELGPAHRRPRAQTARSPRAGLLRPQARRRQRRQGSMRCLKRRLSDVVFRQLTAERAVKNPEGRWGRHSHPARLT